MYAKNPLAESVTVQSDKGSLRLQFSTKYNPIFGGKRKHQGLGMKDTPENWQKAIAIAWRIEEDLQHADWQLLFDRTFAKYGLKTKYAAELKLAAPIPEPEPEMTVGAMWEDYLIWKEPQLQPTTFRSRFQGASTAIIKGLYNPVGVSTHDTITGIYDLPLSAVNADMVMAHPAVKANKINALVSLSEAFTRLQSLGQTRLTANPFNPPKTRTTRNKTDRYKSAIDSNGEIKEWWHREDTETDLEERDRRAFTKIERDIIINGFYKHEKKAARQMAPLVEFRFLTGCRSGEAFALCWGDVFLGKDKNKIVFNKSYSGVLKNTQVTKTGEARVFTIYPKLCDLLMRIKPADARPNDLVFTKLNGKQWDSSSVQALWCAVTSTSNGITRKYFGVVTELVDNGLVSSYLPFYACRHTFITLQAHAGTDLFLLATICGNSVEVIQRHYLGINTEVTVTDI